MKRKERCEEWSVKGNTEKCDILFFRKKEVRISKEEFSVN